ncbi:hypothetical protein CEXT_774591 [Caerostris extrusa]|uniref:Uncharacterized protein n=1 Tax=Caerostris extrusa TaxID=172846 RepID=A0AAV4UBU0_CAEEX|nr:hypothetical protein CEXT_774591 [Caerostris extrusa]
MGEPKAITNSTPYQRTLIETLERFEKVIFGERLRTGIASNPSGVEADTGPPKNPLYNNFPFDKRSDFELYFLSTEIQCHLYHIVAGSIKMETVNKNNYNNVWKTTKVEGKVKKMLVG